MDNCDCCQIEISEDELQEVRLKNTRTNMFVCPVCSEDIEKFTLIL